jgi:hypothetical protein
MPVARCGRAHCWPARQLVAKSPNLPPREVSSGGFNMFHQLFSSSVLKVDELGIKSSYSPVQREKDFLGMWVAKNPNRRSMAFKWL